MDRPQGADRPATTHPDLLAAEAEARAQALAELVAAQQSVSDLEWAAQISEVLSATLDEQEVLKRLAGLVVGRLADVAIADLVDEDTAVRRVGVMVADSVTLDVEAVLERPEVGRRLPPGSRTFQAVSGRSLTYLGPDEIADARLLSLSTRALLQALDTQCALVIPLTARDRVVGLLGLIRTPNSVPFDGLDMLVATDIGARAALAVDNARLYRAQSDIAERLQRALLPQLPPAAPVQAAARYLPARARFEVGGDWYDLFPCPNEPQQLVLVVGDVAGHDLNAATTMAAMRNLLRGVAVAGTGGPAGVLAAVDENLEPLGIVGTATAVLMTVRPSGHGDWSLTWSNAGHLPVLLLLPDGAVELLAQVHGPLLGAQANRPRREDTRAVPGGTTVVLYTDGLVEKRGEIIDDGLQRLDDGARALRSRRDDPAAVADELIERTRASVEDDTVVLCVHLP